MRHTPARAPPTRRRSGAAAQDDSLDATELRLVGGRGTLEALARVESPIEDESRGDQEHRPEDELVRREDEEDGDDADPDERDEVDRRAPSPEPGQTPISRVTIAAWQPLKGGDPVRDRLGTTDLQGSDSGSTRNVRSVGRQ